MPLLTTRAGASARAFGLFSNIRGEEYILFSGANTPYINVYPWSSLGFGTKQSNPSTLPTSARQVQWSPKHDSVVLSQIISPFFSAWGWTKTGFGAKFADPTTLFGTSTRAIAINPSADSVVFSALNNVTNNIRAWQLTSTSFGTQYSNPATAITSVCMSAQFTPSGSDLVIASTGTPFIHAYQWSSGFGTKYSNPTTLPGISNDIHFSNINNYVAVCGGTAPSVHVYQWSSGFGTKFSNPATAVSVSPNWVRFSNSTNYIALAGGASPYIEVYAWSSSGFGSKYANPATALSTGSTAPPAGTSPVFSNQETELILSGDGVASGVSAVQAYKWSSSGFGTKYSDPSTVYSGGVLKVTISQPI